MKDIVPVKVNPEQHAILRGIASSEDFASNGGILFACAYPVRELRDYNPRITKLRLTYCGEPDKIMTLSNALYECSKSHEKQQTEALGAYRFNMQLVNIKSNLAAEASKTFLYAATGVSGKIPYPDDAMYEVDDMGMQLLKVGLENKVLPAWVWSNYNFMKIDRNKLRDGVSALNDLQNILESTSQKPNEQVFA